MVMLSRIKIILLFFAILSAWAMAYAGTDFDNDSDIDGLDLAVFADTYSIGDPMADLNNDGSVNTDDVTTFAQDFGSVQSCTPSISALTPNFGPSGMAVTIEGERFGEQRWSGDTVLIGSQGVTPYSWSDTLIEFRVPVGLSPGIYDIAVRKAANPLTGCGEETSNQLPFEATSHPGVDTIDPTESTCGGELEIYGEGFGINQEEINTDGFGYSTYVELSASADQYRITQYPDGWLGPDHIKVCLQNLFDVNTGSEIPDWQLFHGTWTVKVITDYFRDDGDGVYNLGLNGLDADDEFFYQARSNSISLTVTQCQRNTNE
jgi:hypothetical protein